MVQEMVEAVTRKPGAVMFALQPPVELFLEGILPSVMRPVTVLLEGRLGTGSETHYIPPLLVS